jgi:hypothetical protein
MERISSWGTNSSSASHNTLHYMISEVSLLYSQELAIYLNAEPAESSDVPFHPKYPAMYV